MEQYRGQTIVELGHINKSFPGVYQKGSGAIRVFGETVKNTNPKRAQELGIGFDKSDAMLTADYITENGLLAKSFGLKNQRGCLDQGQSLFCSKKGPGRILVGVFRSERARYMALAGSL